MEINKLGVVGAGQMGAGIAQVAAAVGIEVFINDISDELIAKGIAKISKSLGKLVSKERSPRKTPRASPCVCTRPPAWVIWR